MNPVLAGILGGLAIGGVFGWLYGRGVMRTRISISPICAGDCNEGYGPCGECAEARPYPMTIDGGCP